MARSFLTLVSLLLLTVSLAAQERKPADGSPRGERNSAEGAPRGERAPGPPRDAGARGERLGFPAEIKLTDEQQAKLKEMQANVSSKVEELGKKRDAILTAEQTTARAAADKKIHEGGLSRQEIGDLLSAALKLTAEQKTQMDAIEQELQQLRREAGEQRMALLNEEQKAILRKLNVAWTVERQFGLPGEINLTGEQKAGLKSLHEELGPKLAEWSEKRGAIMTAERQAALEAAQKAARESNLDRQAYADAVNAALNLSQAEKTQLAEVEQSLRDLYQQIQDRKLALLTAEQKDELQKRFGSGRGR
jgi:Spy/CpxP family protein refolding chaperone